MADRDQNDQNDQATTFEMEILVFLSQFPLINASSDEEDLDCSAVKSLFSENLTSVEEIETWFPGYVPDWPVPETFRRELKSVRLVTATDSAASGFTEDDFRQMIETSDFSPLTTHAGRRLQSVMKYYVPRYFTAFLNSKILSAEMLFGVEDDGVVTGVVVPIDITSEQVRQMVWHEVETTIRSQISEFGGDEVIEHYIRHVEQNLRVEMVEIDPNLSMLDDWADEFIRTQTKKIDEYQIRRHIYTKELQSLGRVIQYYRRGVEEMLQDTRVHFELAHFIRTHDPSGEEVEGLDALTIELRERLVARTMRIPEEPITYEDGQISDEKGDVRNMAYWITRLRDIRVDQLRVQKPKALIGPSPNPLYTSLMVRNPVQRIISNLGSKMKVVIIQVVFPGHLSIPLPPGRDYHRAMSYIGQTGGRRTTVRHMNSNGPSCI